MATHVALSIGAVQWCASTTLWANFSQESLKLQEIIHIKIYNTNIKQWRTIRPIRYATDQSDSRSSCPVVVFFVRPANLADCSDLAVRSICSAKKTFF
jgi:hypothetical protein